MEGSDTVSWTALLNRALTRVLGAVDVGDADEQMRAQQAYGRLRRLVGALAFLIPPGLVVSGIWVGESLHDSISDYYHVPQLRNCFVGLLFAVAFFLFGYGAYSPRDDRLASIGGAAMIGVALFPVRVCPTSHYVCAAVLFVVLAVFCLCLFTRGGKRNAIERRHIRIYKNCGITILVCIGLIAGYSACRWANVCTEHSVLARLKPVLVLEWIALWAFGLSWSVKGQLYPAIRSLVGARS